MSGVLVDYALQSAYSDPGRWASLLDDLPTDPSGLSQVARNGIAHYRAEAAGLPEETRDEIGLRWLAEILSADQGRNPPSLLVERPLASRVQGCCRDHTLLCVGALRHHGLEARSRVGFARYFTPGWHHDHVIVEVRRDGRWRRFDSELGGRDDFDPHDVPSGPESPFVTAAEAWLGHRAGRFDVTTFGVDPDHPASGEWFVRSYVVMEIAHRYKDELLLWDGWGVMGPEADDAATGLVDEIATLLVAADAGDAAAETELHERYRADARLHPGDTVMSFSPNGETASVSLAPPATTVG